MKRKNKIENHNKKRRHKRSVYFYINIFLSLCILAIIIPYLLYTFDIKININKIFNSIDFKDFININKENDKKNNDFDLNSINMTSTSTLSSTSTTATSTENKEVKIISNTYQYLKIINSCDVHFNGVCVRARSCPGLSCPVIANLRDDMVLRTDGKITEADGVKWYHVIFDEWVRYPERTAKEWYISSDFVELVEAKKEKFAKDSPIIKSETKEIIVKLSKQKIYAYDGDELFMETSISSGLEDMPTPRGVFYIFEKTPSRYMQGPLPGVSEQEYDLPGVPWTMYFTYQGAALHGAYWHNNFGQQWSHGCVNLTPVESQKLYEWADLGTKVIVKD